MQQTSNKQQQQREEPPIKVANMEIKDKWLLDISENVKDDERKFIFNLCFQIMRQKQNLDILQKNPSSDQRSQDLIKNNINEIQNVSLSKTFDDQQNSSYQIMKQIVNNHVVLEDEKYKIQKFRRNYLLRNARQIGESIQIQPTTQGKAPQILQIHDYYLQPQKNSIIQSESGEIDASDKNILEFNKSSALKWEEKTCRYRIVLIPQNLKKNVNQNGELDQQIIKQNIELIYMIYFKSFSRLQKIMNYALITSRQDSIDEYTYALTKCAKVFNKSLTKAFRLKLKQYTENLALKNKTQQIDKLLDLPTAVSQEDFNQTPMSKKKMESSLGMHLFLEKYQLKATFQLSEQAVKGSQNELKEEGSSKDKKSLELQKIPEEKESDQNFSSESIGKYRTQLLSKKSGSFTLYPVQNSNISPYSQYNQDNIEQKLLNDIYNEQIVLNNEKNKQYISDVASLQNQGQQQDKQNQVDSGSTNKQVNNQQNIDNSPKLQQKLGDTSQKNQNFNKDAQKVVVNDDKNKPNITNVESMKGQQEIEQKPKQDAPMQNQVDSGSFTKQLLQQQKEQCEQVPQGNNQFANSPNNKGQMNSQKDQIVQTSSEQKKSDNPLNEKYLKVNDILNNQNSQDISQLQNNREFNNQIMDISQKIKVQQNLNLSYHKNSSQYFIGQKGKQGESQSQQEFHSPIKGGSTSPNNFQSEFQLKKDFEQSGFLDYQSPQQMFEEEFLYEKITNSNDKRILANPNNLNRFETPAKSLNQQGQKKMSEMKAQVQSYMQDPQVKQFIENENLQDHIKVSEKLPVQLKQNNLNQEKQYCITKIMIHWYEEESFDDFYNEVKDLVIGNNVVTLQELTYKFSNKKEINKSENVWQLDSRIQFSQDDILAQAAPKKRMNGSGLSNYSEVKSNQTNSSSKMFDASWKVAIRNQRGIEIVNGEFRIGETLLSSTEYGREQFLILRSPFESLSQSLFAILHLIIEIQPTEKQQEQQIPSSQSVKKQNKPQQQELNQNKVIINNSQNQQIYGTSFFKNSIERIRNEENFMYYLITNKTIIIPKRYVWIKFINDPEINKIRYYYQLLQADIEYSEVLNKCKRKLEEFNIRRIKKIIEWQGKMQAELLMLNVRKNFFDTLMLKPDKKVINNYIVHKGIPNEYRFCIYSSILDLHQQLVNTKQLLEDLFQKPCTNVVQYLIQESKNFCNSLVVSASSFIFKKFPYALAKAQAIFEIYQAYLMYDYISYDKPNQMLISPSISLLINIYESFIESEQETLAYNFQLQQRIPKIQQMKTSIPQNLSHSQQFKIACQQFEQQQFFVFAALMNLLKEVDFNFIFFSLMNTLNQGYANLNLDNQIPSLKDLIFEGCYSFYSNILVGELWNRIIDTVFIELIAIQKLEINFFLYCISKTILCIYIDYHIEESVLLNQEFVIGECFDEQIYDFYRVYLNTKRFFEVFCSIIKNDIIIYQQITAQYSDYLTKMKMINSQSVYRQNYTYNNFNQFYFEEQNLNEQFNLELLKLKDCEEYADKQINDQRQVDLFIYLNDIAPNILQSSQLKIIYEGIKQQIFIPNENPKKLQLSFKTKIPFLKTNTLYSEIEGREQIKFELILQVSNKEIYFIGYIEWDPVSLFYKKTLVYLSQINSVDIEKTLLLSVYLEPTQQQPNQPLITSTVQNKYYEQNYIRNDVNTIGQCPIFMNEGISLMMYKFDYKNLQISNISTTIDPLRFSPSGNISKSQSKYPIQISQKNFSKEAINDWFAKISYLIANNSQLSIDEKLQLLYLGLKSAFGFEVSIKNVLLLLKEIARIQGFILNFESLLERVSQIIGRRLKNYIAVSNYFIDENGNKQQFLADSQYQNYLLDTSTQILEKEYEEVISQTLEEGIHLVDIRTIISQVHQNLLLKNSITYLTQTNIIHNYQLQVMVDGCKNNYFIDSNGMIIITKSVIEQQILITKIPIFKNISICQSMFLGIMQQSPFILSYFCKFPKLQFFTKQIPLALQLHFFHLKSQQIFSPEAIKIYTLVDSIGYIIDDILSKGILPKQYSFSQYSCLTAERQILYLNDNLINQIDIQRMKELQDNNLLITLNIYLEQEPQYKLPFSDIEKCKILLNNKLDAPNLNQSEENYQQFQAVVFTKEGIDFQKVYKLDIKDVYQFSNKKSRISEKNIKII